MELVDFVSFDDIRGALGVDESEISDATLSLDLYLFGLVSDLEDVSLSIVTDYIALRDAATDPLPDPSWTAAETRFYQQFTLFCTYAVAKELTVALPMFGAKEETDGKASMVRFSQDPYKNTIASVLQRFESNKTKLAAAYSDLTSSSAPTSVSRPYFTSGSPDSDPVLGS